MILYHYDRVGTLCPGTDVQLIPLDSLVEDLGGSTLLKEFPTGISKHAQEHLKLTCASSPSSVDLFGRICYYAQDIDKQLLDASTRMIELNFELVRRVCFPQYPSRFQCLFALRSKEDLTQWPELTGDESNTGGHFLQIRTNEDIHCFDSAWLLGGFMHGVNNGRFHISYAPSICFDCAYKYWSKVQSETPRWEYLIPLPINGSYIEDAPA